RPDRPANRAHEAGARPPAGRAPALQHVARAGSRLLRRRAGRREADRPTRHAPGGHAAFLERLLRVDHGVVTRPWAPSPHAVWAAWGPLRVPVVVFQAHLIRANPGAILRWRTRCHQAVGAARGAHHVLGAASQAHLIPVSPGAVLRRRTRYRQTIRA